MTTSHLDPRSVAAPGIPVTYHRTSAIDGLNIFHREAGPAGAPVVLLLHGFPTSSHMFRNLIPALADRYHVIAPDYPGYGQSDMPDRTKFAYTFDRFAELVDGLLERLYVRRFAMYVMDYGAFVGWRHGLEIPRACHGPDRPERERLRGRAQGILGPDQEVLEREFGGHLKRSSQALHPRNHEISV
jgi:alpha-beta hydrolase superfamily lysophospholipase